MASDCTSCGCVETPPNLPPVDLCADADISVCLHDCKESDVLCFQFAGLCQSACLGNINIPAETLSLSALENGGVLIPGLGTVTYNASTGDFHLAVDPNGQLAYLGYGETADIKFEVTATDLAGCSDSTCFDFTANGGDHGVTVAACVIDGNIQMASDCTSCGCVETPPNLPPVDLCADADISVCLHDCKESDVLCFQFAGLCQSACLGNINIPAETLSLSALENGGVLIPGLGTVTYNASTGDFHLAVDPNGQLAYLGYGETADIKFEVTATDLAGCSDSTCFDFTAAGGDHGLTVAACVIDGNIQMASDCTSCGCVETPPNLPPVDLCADADISVCLHDCKESDVLCFQFAGLNQVACLGTISIDPQSLDLAQLEGNGVVIKGLGTVTYDASTGDFHLAVDPNGQLAYLGYGETADIKFEVTATDLAGCSDSTCFDFTAAGGDHGLTVAACVIDGDIQMAGDCWLCQYATG